jgi:energy-converting hydrogenase A subunit M
VPHFDAATAECTVLTYKEGLLSAVAHDLEIAVTRFDVDVEDGGKALSARFDASSLRVLHAMADGKPREGALSDADKRKIENSIVADVLDAGKHPEIRFVAADVTPEGEGFRVRGELTLHGRTRAIAFVARRLGDRLVAEVQLHQPDFGIRPYSAMLGTLKVKPDVTVRCTLPRAQIAP